MEDGREQLERIQENKMRHQHCKECLIISLGPIEWEFFTQHMVVVRNCLITSNIVHFVVTLISLALTGIRRSVLAMIINIFILAFNIFGLIFTFRFDFKYIKIHAYSMPFLVLLCIITMIVSIAIEQDAVIILLINSPVVLDILFSFIYICMWRTEVLPYKRNYLNKINALKNRLEEPRPPSSPVKAPVPVFPAVRTKVKKIEEAKPGLAPMRSTSMKMCVVCYMNPINTVAYKCGHSFACKKCIEEIKKNTNKCAICRARIIDIIPLHSA
jgi:hypothetical protein